MATRTEWTKGNPRAKEILRELGFENIQIYPKKSGCPFDIYAEKDNRIYLIELKYTAKPKMYTGMPYELPSRLAELTKGTDRIPVMLYINDINNEHVFLRFDFSEISNITRPIVKFNLGEIDKWIKERKIKGHGHN